MPTNPIARLRPLLLGLAFAVTVSPVSAIATGPGSLTVSPAGDASGSKFHIHGTGFVNFSLTTRALELTIFDANNTIVDRGSVDAGDDGSIDADLDTSGDSTSGGSYTSGTYSVLATYTYWGVRRDPNDPLRIICDFCPYKTVPLADPVSFTIR